MRKCAKPTANMNVSTEFTENNLELFCFSSNGIGPGVHPADFWVLEPAALISSKRSLWSEYACVVSSRSVPIEKEVPTKRNQFAPFNICELKFHRIEKEARTFQLHVIPDASVDPILKPFFDPLDFPHVRHGRIALPFAPHHAKVVKLRALVVEQAVRLADVPFHYLAAAEIAHVPDVGVG